MASALSWRPRSSPTPATYAASGPPPRSPPTAAWPPIEVSSGDTRRHRLSRAGDRQLNYALHVIAITQIRRDTAGRAYYQRKRAAGKGHKEALRCLKRQLADVVYRVMLRDTGTSLLIET
ncbi:transposase [Nocardia gipuzkoensis]